MSQLSAVATIDPPAGMTPDEPGMARNLIGGQWQETGAWRDDIPTR